MRTDFCHSLKCALDAKKIDITKNLTRCLGFGHSVSGIGLTIPIIAQEDGEWVERLYTRMLSIADYEVVPTLLSIRFSGEDIVAALRDFYVRGTSGTGAVTTAAAGGACGARVGKKLHMGGHGVAMGTAIGAVVGGVAGGLTGGAVGVVAYNFEKISTIIRLKYRMWTSRRDDIQ